MANSSMFVLAAISAPAARSRSTAVASYGRHVALEDPRPAGGRLLDGDDVVLERDRHAPPSGPGAGIASDPRAPRRRAAAWRPVQRGVEARRRPPRRAARRSPAAASRGRSQRPPSRRGAAPGRSRRRTRARCAAGGRASGTGPRTSSRSATCGGPGEKRLGRRRRPAPRRAGRRSPRSGSAAPPAGRARSSVTASSASLATWSTSSRPMLMRSPIRARGRRRPPAAA